MSELSDERAALPRVVIDTNVLLRGMFKRGLSLPLLQAWMRDDFVMVTSRPLIDELAEVAARPKFKKRITKTDAEKLLELIWRKADVVVATDQPVLVRDPDDYPVLAAAIAGNAAHIVTSDNDLLADPKLKSGMNRFSVNIVTVHEFTEYLRARRNLN